MLHFRVVSLLQAIRNDPRHQDRLAAQLCPVESLMSLISTQYSSIHERGTLVTKILQALLSAVAQAMKAPIRCSS